MAQQTSEPLRPAAWVRSASRPAPRDLATVCGLMSVTAAAGVVGLAGGWRAGSRELTWSPRSMPPWIAVIRTFSWLQPACAVYGAVVLALGLLLRRAGRRRA